MHLACGGRNSPKILVQIGFKKQRMCLGLFTLHSPAGVLGGVICLHVDDMLGTGDDLFESRLKELEKFIGFGSMQRQKFVLCGKAVRGTCQWGNHDFHKATYSELEESLSDS